MPGEAPEKADMPLGNSANINPSVSKVLSSLLVTTEELSTLLTMLSHKYS